MNVCNPVSWGYIISTIIAACWRRKHEGAYGLFLFFFKSLEVLLLIPVAFAVVGVRHTHTVLLLYAWFRRLDDVLDHDTTPPRNCSRSDYIDYKVSLLRQLNSKSIKEVACRYTEDTLLIQAIKNTERYNTTIRQELLREVQHLAWDYHRREKNELATSKRLSFQASWQDRMLFSIFIKILKSDLKSFYAFNPRLKGIFTRLDWLNDMSQDIKNKIVNIPAEVMLSNHISDNITTHPAFITWFNKEVDIVRLEWLDIRQELGSVFKKVFSNYSLCPIICTYFISKFDTLLLNIKKIPN